ncbi:MAG: AIR synthase-related protein, partial [Clostridia bacterium]
SKEKIIDKEKVVNGDVIIGIESSGVHSNGFSLVRKIFGINENTVNKYYDELGSTLGETLLTPTKIYVKPILELCAKVDVKSISHITGGGFYENLPRALNQKSSVKIEKNAVNILPIFNLMQSVGKIPQRDMFNTFNMGVGMAVIVSKNDADKAMNIIRTFGERCSVIGEVISGEKEVIIC